MVIALIRDGDLRAALVRLWVLSMQRTADNGSVELIQWETNAGGKGFASGLYDESKRQASISVGHWRVAAHDFCGIQAIGKIIQNAGHCNPRARHTSPAAANGRVNTDMFVPIHGGLLLAGSAYVRVDWNPLSSVQRGLVDPAMITTLEQRASTSTS